MRLHLLVFILLCAILLSMTLKALAADPGGASNNAAEPITITVRINLDDQGKELAAKWPDAKCVAWLIWPGKDRFSQPTSPVEWKVGEGVVLLTIPPATLTRLADTPTLRVSVHPGPSFPYAGELRLSLTLKAATELKQPLVAPMRLVTKHRIQVKLIDAGDKSPVPNAPAMLETPTDFYAQQTRYTSDKDGLITLDITDEYTCTLYPLQNGGVIEARLPLTPELQRKATGPIELAVPPPKVAGTVYIDVGPGQSVPFTDFNGGMAFDRGTPNNSIRLDGAIVGKDAHFVCYTNPPGNYRVILSDAMSNIYNIVSGGTFTVGQIENRTVKLDIHLRKRAQYELTITAKDSVSGGAVPKFNMVFSEAGVSRGTFQSDDKGKFYSKDFAEGSFDLHVEAPGYVPLDTTLAFSKATKAELSLTPYRILTFEVTGTDGKPVKGVAVALMHFGRGGEPEDREATTNPNGEAVIERVVAGPAFIMVQDHAKFPYYSSITIKDDARINLPCAATAPVTGHLITTFPKVGSIGFIEHTSRAPAAYVTVNKQMHFDVEMLPGKYDVYVVAEDRYYPAGSLEVSKTLAPQMFDVEPDISHGFLTNVELFQAAPHPSHFVPTTFPSAVPVAPPEIPAPG